MSRTRFRVNPHSNETLIVTDPVFSKEAVEQYVENKPNYKKGKISAFATGNEENPDVCIYFNERHKLEGCNSFMDPEGKNQVSSKAKILLWMLKTND